MGFHSTDQIMLTPLQGLQLQSAAWTARRQRRQPQTRRIRTAMSKPLEFVRTCDVVWAALLSALVAPAAALALELSLAGALALGAGLFIASWLVLWMALINCNPYPPGYTVFDSFRSMTRALPTLPVTHLTDLRALDYPLIFKPAKCSTNSSQVRLICSRQQARQYLIDTLEDVVCAQQYHPGEEYTIMWERWPWRAQGAVVDVHWRRKTHPRGEFHPLSGSDTPKVTEEANQLNTAALQATVTRMMLRMPHVYCTRFDVRATSHEALARGDFRVMESNGTIGVQGGSTLYGVMVHWPRRMITGLYNMLFHPNGSVHPRLLLARLRAFNHCGGWDFRFCDGY